MTTEKLRAENPNFDSFCLDFPEDDDDTIDQFVKYIDRWPNDLKLWTYKQFLDEWNRWV